MPTWDLHLLQLINGQWTHPVLDWLMPAVSAISAWLPFFIIAALLIAWRGGRHARLMLLCIGLAIALGDGLISNVLKKSVGRVRPRDAVAGLVIRDLGPGQHNFLRLFQPPTTKLSTVRGDKRGNSFPSSHVVNMFAFATVLSLFYPRHGLWAYPLAMLVAYSRLYVAAHWPTDIIPSLAMGVLVGLLVTNVIQRLINKRRRSTNIATE